MPEITPTIVSVVIAIIAAIPGILSLRQQRKEQDAKVADIISKASAQLITQYEKRMNEMEENDTKHQKQIEEMRAEIQSLRILLQQKDYVLLCRDNYIEHLLNGIKRLVAQLISLNAKPNWEPDDCKNFFTVKQQEE